MTNKTDALLTVTDLAVDFGTMDGTVHAVTDVNFSISPGETVAIVGESGSGKSTTAMAVIGLLASGGRIVGGSVRLDGVELANAPEAELRKIRGRDIGLVPQDPMSNLNPVTRIGDQVAEALLAHKLADRKNVDQEVHKALVAAGIPNPEERAKQYPHELSGGLRQRALIAIGLACRPRLLIADEPTSALDVTVQQTILDQLAEMTQQLGTSVLLITHDLGLAAERAQRVIVMHRGKIVEQGPSKEILENPQHEYTKRLVAAAPSVAAARMTTTAARAEQIEHAEQSDAESSEIVLKVRDLTKIYPVRGRNKDDFIAVDNVSFDVERGKTLSIVGESGSGKTTTARMILNLIKPTSGDIDFEGTNIAQLGRGEMSSFRQRVQPIFQDPFSSLNPMFTIERLVREPLDFYKRGSASERRTVVRELMDAVELPQSMLRRYPSELSGGQRQRVAIARALALGPEVIVCDEPVSALDVLVQAQILDLLTELQKSHGYTYLFISHDLAVVRLISDYVCVMKDGKIVEQATSEEIFTNPRDPYTRKLLASIPGNELGIAS